MKQDQRKSQEKSKKIDSLSDKHQYIRVYIENELTLQLALLESLMDTL